MNVVVVTVPPYGYCAGGHAVHSLLNIVLCYLVMVVCGPTSLAVVLAFTLNVVSTLCVDPPAWQ